VTLVRKVILIRALREVNSKRITTLGRRSDNERAQQHQRQKDFEAACELCPPFSQ